MQLSTLFGLFALLFVVYVSCETHFEEEFGKGWDNRWVVSSWKKSEGQAGEFKVTAGDYYGDKEADKGLQTTQDARFYATSAKFPSFSNKGKDLVLQYSVKYTQKIGCGCAYIKLLPSTLDQEHFSGDSDYHIMFGPDVCGYSTKKVHVIFNYKGKNHLINKDIKCETDRLTHLYTLIVHPDNTYEVLLDQKEVGKGSLFEDWDFLPAKEIKDPNQSKPSDWVDQKEIADPEDVKPEGWDEIPKFIVDPEATKPEDWDDELDGEWEAPQISNPEYKGEWRAKQIPNPEYKGEWVHPLIPNPEYAEDKEIYSYSDIGAVGFELWQVEAGTIFDNIIVTDSLEEANALAEKTFVAHKDAEKKALDDLEEKKKAEEEAERKKAEEARKAQEEEEEEDDDEDDEDDDEDDEDEDDDEDDEDDHHHSSHKDEL